MDIDSINNQLFIEETDADDPKIIEEVEKLEEELKMPESTVNGVISELKSANIIQEITGYSRNAI